MRFRSSKRFFREFGHEPRYILCLWSARQCLPCASDLPKGLVYRSARSLLVKVLLRNAKERGSSVSPGEHRRLRGGGRDAGRSSSAFGPDFRGCGTYRWVPVCRQGTSAGSGPCRAGCGEGVMSWTRIQESSFGVRAAGRRSRCQVGPMSSVAVDVRARRPCGC